MSIVMSICTLLFLCLAYYFHTSKKGKLTERNIHRKEHSQKGTLTERNIHRKEHSQKDIVKVAIVFTDLQNMTQHHSSCPDKMVKTSAISLPYDHHNRTLLV